MADGTAGVRASADVVQQQQLSTTIKDKTTRCLQSFHTLLEARLNQASQVENNLTRFRIWAGNVGAWRKTKSRTSADYRLRDAPEIRTRILRLLDDVYDTNEGARSSFELNGNAIEDDGFNEVETLVLCVGDIITSLMKISILIMKATARDRYAQALASSSDSLSGAFAEHDKRHISDKFPKIRNRGWLLERFTQAMTARRCFLRYAQDHKDKISSEAGSDDDSDRQTTAASTLQPDKAAELMSQENFDTESQASSILSDVDEELDEVADVVPLDSLAEPDEPFECPYCRQIQQFETQRSWR